MILAGDIGGTNTRLALFEEEGTFTKFEEARFHSVNYPSLLSIVKEYVRDKREKIKRACFAVAGPIQNGRSRLTNIPSWVVDVKEFQQDLGISSVLLLNDLEANAWGLSILGPEDFALIQQGNPRQVGNAVLISAGTGLGEAGLYWDGKKHCPFACEGGHADFAPRNSLEFELHTWLQKKYGRHVSYERVVSGPGLYALYQFLIDSRKEQEDEQLTKAMKERDPPQVLTQWGKSGRDSRCTRVLDWFLSLYGAEAGNAALKFLALGGVYLGGGIAPHLVEQMKTEFLKSFLDKGRFKPLLETIPIRVVLNDEAALLGTAAYARNKKAF
jgi:glucokinase